MGHQLWINDFRVLYVLCWRNQKKLQISVNLTFLSKIVSKALMCRAFGDYLFSFPNGDDRRRSIMKGNCKAFDLWHHNLFFHHVLDCYNERNTQKLQTNSLSSLIFPFPWYPLPHVTLEKNVNKINEMKLECISWKWVFGDRIHWNSKFLNYI